MYDFFKKLKMSMLRELIKIKGTLYRLKMRFIYVFKKIIIY
ncbi:hypothetical protein WPG_1410 [Winogradskyella sp. PG-2]|nr:hypothetical protein WPG_1410 [Winogradskyella sp. PG-2]